VYLSLPRRMPVSKCRPPVSKQASQLKERKYFSDTRRRPSLNISDLYLNIILQFLQRIWTAHINSFNVLHKNNPLITTWRCRRPKSAGCLPSLRETLHPIILRAPSSHKSSNFRSCKKVCMGIFETQMFVFWLCIPT
jgi:hypothetical protein